MMKPPALSVLLCCAIHAGGEPDPQREPVWQGAHAIPGHLGDAEKDEAFYTVHRPEKPNGTLVVVCPGGGYHQVVKGPEGSGIARWLNEHGITAVVLEYRLPRGNGHRPTWDAQRAIRIARHHAKDWNCDPRRVGIIGFSAGGHLAAVASTTFTLGELGAENPVNAVSSRPDFAMLIYPITTMADEAITHKGSKEAFLTKKPGNRLFLIDLASPLAKVRPNTPPTFLAHAADDTVVSPENSRRYHAALKEQGVKTRYLELPAGGHGLNRYQGPHWDAWQQASLDWLRSIGMLAAP